MTLQELNSACERLEAAQACRNLVGRLSYYNSAFRINDMLELWDTTGEALLQLPDHTYRGYEEIRSALLRRGDRNAPGMAIQMRGVLRIHNMNSDLLEISADCAHAHGTWFSPGLETELYNPEDPTAVPDKTDTSKLEASASYIWQEYAIDFVKRTNGWKIQKLTVRTFFDTPFDTPWSECSNTLWAPDHVIHEM